MQARCWAEATGDVVFSTRPDPAQMPGASRRTNASFRAQRKRPLQSLGWNLDRHDRDEAVVRAYPSFPETQRISEEVKRDSGARGVDLLKTRQHAPLD